MAGFSRQGENALTDKLRRHYAVDRSAIGCAGLVVDVYDRHAPWHESPATQVQPVSRHSIASLDHHRAVVDRGEHLGGVAGDDDVDDGRAVTFFHALPKCGR